MMDMPVLKSEAYSASLPQKPYGIETRDQAGMNLSVPLFHMPAENDWILLANYNDKVFMRNSLAFQLFREMGHYAPRTMFCEAIVNGQYQGIYVFTEKIKRDKGRVDIAALNPDENSGDDATGGYIFKIDYYDGSNSWQSTFPPMGYADKEVYLSMTIRLLKRSQTSRKTI
ncbi:MAG: CotH kinase family protein [Cyclobacteriaceae bacterium]|nr:CotH kinase family protein [Cyclobacteriaceae bacterium]